MSPPAKEAKETGVAKPPAQCSPDDFACIALQYPELYRYVVGTEGCIDPPTCTKKGRKPAELLSKIFTACSEEARGDLDRFTACVSDIAELMEKVGRKISLFVK